MSHVHPLYKLHFSCAFHVCIMSTLQSVTLFEKLCILQSTFSLTGESTFVFALSGTLIVEDEQLSI